MAFRGGSRSRWNLQSRARRIAVGALLGALLMAAACLPALVASGLSHGDLSGLLDLGPQAAVTWRGEPEIGVFPTLQVSLTDVEIRRSRGGAGDAVARVPAVEISFKTLPLLWGRMVADRVDLRGPDIRVGTDRSGAGSLWFHGWLTGDGDVAPPDLVVLSDGVIRYTDQGTGRTQKIRAWDLQLRWHRDDRTLTVGGRFDVAGRTLDVAGELTEPWDLFTSAGAPGRLLVDASPDGPAMPFQAEGSFRLLQSGDRDNPGSLQIADADFRFGDALARGTLAVSDAGTRPRVAGHLAFDEVYLGSYLEDWLPDSLAELLAMPVSARWLNLADVDLELRAEQVSIGTGQVDEAEANLDVRDGRLALTITEAAVAGGHLRTALTASASGSEVVVNAVGRVDDVSVSEAGAYLGLHRTGTLIGVEPPPQGSATGSFRLSTRGTTVRALIASLAGWAVADVRDGSLGGADAVSTLERVVDDQAGIAEGEAPFIPIAGRTHFSRLAARVVAGDGVARLERVRLEGEGFDISLAGELDLTGGELVAEGTARLYGDEGAQGSTVLVELPFGVGGTVRDPMGAPGIPRQHADPGQTARHVTPVRDGTRRRQPDVG